jgi:hypothetical protein
MLRAFLAALVAVIVLLVGAGTWTLFHTASPASQAPATAVPAAPYMVRETRGVEARYVNTKRGFSLGMPEGLLAQEGTDTNGATDVRLHDAAGTPYLQVLIVPSDGDPAAMTLDAIEKDAPGTKAGNAIGVDVLPGVTGIAFEGENPLWGGASSELWFAYRGYRYQLSASLANAQLLAYIWNSWQWR